MFLSLVIKIFLTAAIDWRQTGCIAPSLNFPTGNDFQKRAEVYCAVEAVVCQVANITGKIINLSKRQPYDCMPKASYFGDALRYIQKAGLETETDYPNPNNDTVCNYNAARVAVKVPKIGVLTGGTEKALEKALHVVFI